MKAPTRKPEVRLNPALQAQLLEQMREEQTAAIRSRRIKLFVLLPAVVGATIVSLMMALANDSTIAIIGNVVASSLLLFFWKVRKRIGAALGLSNE
jgi:hypothetical protein